MVSFPYMASYSVPLPNDKRFEHWAIEVSSTRDEIDVPGQPPVREIITLKGVLDKYALTLGFQNAHLLEVLITLMTTGKVCVEFRSFTERLQLCDLSRIMTRPAAIELFNDYLVRSREKKISSGKEATRRITVQLPKISPVAPRNMPGRAPPVP
jgi:hypothetical protein